MKTNDFGLADKVVFPGIGKGIVIAIVEINDRTYYKVKFRGAPVPHLCARHELQRIDWHEKLIPPDERH